MTDRIENLNVVIKHVQLTHIRYIKETVLIGYITQLCSDHLCPLAR